MYAPGRGRASASPRGSVHLASVGLAQGAPKRLASGSDGEQTRRETSRTQPPQLRARALVDQEIAERLASGEDFGFESTWSGTSRLAIVRDAANRGYDTRAVFLGTDAPHINIERVRRRVLEGGHDIAESEIRRRWKQAFENLLAMWDVIETIHVLDSSRDPLQLIAEKREGKTATLAPGLPAWAERLAKKNPEGGVLEV